MSFHENIKTRDVRVGVLGVGVVGEELVRAIASAGFNVVGLDSDPHRIETLKKKEPPLPDNVLLMREFAPLRSCEVVLVCVPTPLRKDGYPDLLTLQQ